MFNKKRAIYITKILSSDFIRFIALILTGISGIGYFKAYQNLKGDILSLFMHPIFITAICLFSVVMYTLIVFVKNGQPRLRYIIPSLIMGIINVGFWINFAM